MTELEQKIQRLIADYRTVDTTGMFTVGLHPDDYASLGHTSLRVSIDPSAKKGEPTITPLRRVKA